MDGDNYFTKSDFFGDCIYYAHYQLQPGNQFIYPGGYLTRDPTMPVSQYDRDYIQIITYWLPEKNQARRYGQWYLEHIVPSYESSFLYKDMLYKLGLPSRAQDTLPTSYQAAGTAWCNFRSGWGESATCVSLSGNPVIDQGHTHHDVGSFTIWKHGWLALDASSKSNDGHLWEPGAHNMLQVEGSQRRHVTSVPGLTRYWENKDMTFAYVQINGTNLFRQEAWPEDTLLLQEYTREFVYLRPDTVVVYDRVEPREGTVYYLRFHFTKKPDKNQGYSKLYQARNSGGSISILPLVCGAISLHEDTDLGLEYQTSSAGRVQEAPLTPTTGRFLNVLQVASGAPPALRAKHVTTTDKVMEGVLWESNVILFSTKALGACPETQFSYRIPGRGKRTHTLFNMMPEGHYKIAATRSGDQTTITVTQAIGSTEHKANSEGVLRFTM
jgi:hypothetical protein